ncbi:hypothetical protein CK500_12020 [Halorubrum salipaludis]|uniref:DUF1102 domain-containing protein n=1 Tax=Halorubrum salipaludis TaxID=2032630 RepID=A0A2A2FE04_9EURY|nr:hypothetical protein [Halorubrum salipaludis]PAU82852.1 hypothetical protein CK500_12020 [Halorubrum salipaludis]
MKRRSFLLGTGSAAAGGSALIGTGAFSRIDAQRSVTIQVAEDDNAYLGMNDCIDGDGNETPNSSFADLDDLGHLRVDMGESGNGGSGVNSESISWFDNVFQLCNQGKEDVCLWISEKDGADPDRVTFYVNEEPETTTPEKLAFQDGDLVEDDPDLQTLTGVDDSILLEVGHCVCVGIQVYTREDDDYEITAPGAGDELLSEVSLVADVGEEACRAEPECAELDAFIDCYQESPDEGDEFPGTTAFDVTNVGDAAPDMDSVGFAILDSPDEEDMVMDNGDPLDPGETAGFSADTGLPLRGIVYWTQAECDPGDVPYPTRDDWTADDSNFVTLDPAVDDFFPTDSTGSLDALTEARYTEVRDVSDFADLADAFDDAVADLYDVVPSDAFVTEVDLSDYQIISEDEWEVGNLGDLEECSG